MPKNVPALALTLIVCLGLAACSSSSARKAEYLRSKSLPSLEMPPDLTEPELQGEMDLPQSYLAQEAQADRQGSEPVLPKQANVEIFRDRDMRWLRIHMAPEKIWARLRTFWELQGLELKKDQPRLGIMETQWAENRADIPGDWITNLVSKVFKSLYSAPTRDKFRMRLERTDDDEISEIIVTHYGLEELQRGKDEFYETVWQSRPSDPELEAEILSRMMAYFGTPKELADKQLASAVAAQQQARARIDGDMLRIEEPFVRAWRRVGIALDRLGLVVEDRDRSAGVYYVRPADQVKDAKKKGFFSSLFSKKSDEQQSVAEPARIELHEDGDLTFLIVQGRDGATISEAEAKTILEQLESELR